MSLSNICLLCIESNGVSIEIFSRRGIELEIEAILKEHFRLQVEELEEKSICEQCWRTVHDFHVLFTSVKLNHQRQIDFHVKSEFVDSNECSELSVLQLLDIVKDEANIDINKDSEYFDVPDIPCDGDAGDGEQTNDNSPTVAQIKRKYNRKLYPTKKVYKSDTHTALLSLYFNMSCDLCNARLPTYREAKKHYRIAHKIEKGYLICCGTKYVSLPMMLQHCQWHMNPNSFKCDHCSKTYLDSRRLRMHINNCHTSESGKKFYCNDCDKVFSKQCYLNVHVKNKHSPHPSASVNMKCSEYYLYKEHEMIRNRFLMTCDLCDEPFVIFRDVKMHHAKAHNQDGYLYCCGKKFFKMSRAVQHCMWHDDPKSLKCSICEISFMDKISLREHIRKIHSQAAESFSDSSISKSHKKVCVKDIKKKTGERRFECYICRQGFLILPLLRGHMKTVHRSVSAHICELCAKSFSGAQSFKMHFINSHTDTSQRVQCEQCGKWLKHKSSLKNHIRRHNSKTATCGICRRVCNSMEALKRHIQSIHREASLECTVCGKMFRHRKLLQEHISIHTGVTDLYTCTFCTKTFRSNANMYSHRKRAHPVELEQMKTLLNCATPTATT